MRVAERVGGEEDAVDAGRRIAQVTVAMNRESNPILVRADDILDVWTPDIPLRRIEGRGRAVTQVMGHDDQVVVRRHCPDLDAEFICEASRQSIILLAAVLIEPFGVSVSGEPSDRPHNGNLVLVQDEGRGRKIVPARGIRDVAEPVNIP